MGNYLAKRLLFDSPGVIKDSSAETEKMKLIAW
jgi:hypothetical protein